MQGSEALSEGPYKRANDRVLALTALTAAVGGVMLIVLILTGQLSARHVARRLSHAR